MRNFAALAALLLLMSPLATSCRTTTPEQREAERFIQEQVRQGSGLWFYAYTNGVGPAVVVTPKGPVGPLAAIGWAKGPGKCPQWDSGCRSMEEAVAKATKARKKKERYCAKHPEGAECHP